LIVPSDVNFSWNQREGWNIALRESRIPFEMFGVGSGRINDQLSKVAKADLVIFLNDHHLESIFQAIQRTPGHFTPNRDSIWISVATERVVQSPFHRSEEKTRLGSSICQFTAYFDQKAERIIRGAGSIPIFIHQYVDHFTFNSKVSFPQKKPKIFWSGKLPSAQVEGEYSSRGRLFSAIREHKGFEWREAYKPSLSIQQAVRERDSYQGLLHLPSNCPGYTSTFFENLAMGGCVLQYDAGAEYALPDLKAGEHYLSYDALRPETLLEAVETFLLNPLAFQKMAEEGRRLCLKNHTIQQRLLEIFQTVVRSLGQKGIPSPESEAGKAAIEILERLQIAKCKKAGKV